MAHKKAGGSSRNGRDSRGRRLGVKKFGGEIVDRHVVWESRATAHGGNAARLSGLVNVDLTPEAAMRLGMALGTAMARGTRVAASRAAQPACRLIKRALLAGVYSATVLYWLNDKSVGAADSWAFLNRRIDEVMQVPKLLGKVSAVTSRLPNPFRVAQRVRPRGFRARTARG